MAVMPVVVAVDGSEESMRAVSGYLVAAAHRCQPADRAAGACGHRQRGRGAHARRGRPRCRGVAAMLLGSVSRYAAMHAPCPVVVVREAAAGAQLEVVVGIRDPQDTAPLAFAFA